MNDRETTLYRKTHLASAGIIMLALMSAAFGITEWRLPHDNELLNSWWILLWAGMIAFVLFKCFATVRVTDRAVKLSVGISYRREIGLAEIASIEIVHLSPLGSRVDRVRGAIGEPGFIGGPYGVIFAREDGSDLSVSTADIEGLRSALERALARSGRIVRVPKTCDVGPGPSLWRGLTGTQITSVLGSIVLVAVATFPQFHALTAMGGALLGLCFAKRPRVAPYLAGWAMISAPSAVLAFHAPRSLPEAYLVALDVAALVIGIVLVVTSYIPVRRRAA